MGDHRRPGARRPSRPARDEYGVLDRWEESEEARRDALELWRRLGDRLREGDCLRMLSRTTGRLGRGQDAERAIDDALAVLEPHGPTPELARTVVLLSGTRMTNGRFREAMALADRALGLAEALAMADVAADALNNRGTSLGALGGDGLPDLRRAVDLAVEHRLTDRPGART